MKVVTRIVVFIVLLVAMNCGGIVVGIFSSMGATAAITDPIAANQATYAASLEFIFHYWPAMTAIFTLLSALVAFGARLLTFLIGGSLAVGVFFFGAAAS